MDRKWPLIAMVCVAAAACNSNKEAANNQATAKAAAAAPAAPPPGPAPQYSSTYEDLGGQAEELVGKWTGTGNCEQVLELRADGTLANTEGKTGTWSSRPQGDDIEVSMTDGAMAGKSTIRDLDEDGYTMIDQTVRQSVAMARCP